MVKRLLFVAFVIGVSLIALPGHAQEKWRAYASSARQAFEKERYADAIRLLDEAHRLSGNDALLYNVAKASHFKFVRDRQLADVERAVARYRDYLQKVPDGVRRLEATQALVELEPKLPKKVDTETPPPPPPPAPRRTGVVVTTPAGSARIVLDGSIASASPLVAETTPGVHRIFVEAPGHLPVTRDVRVDPGVEIALDIELAVQPGHLSIGGPVGADVRVNGNRVGTLPLREPLTLPPGDYFVAVTQNGREAFTQSVLLGRGAGIHLGVDLETTDQRYASFGVLGASGISFVVGAVLAGLAAAEQSDASELDAQRTQLGGTTPADADAFEDAVAARDDLRVGAISAFGLSGALLATGLFLYFVDEPTVGRPARPGRPGQRSTPNATPAGPVEIGVTPFLGPTLVGGSVRMRF